MIYGYCRVSTKHQRITRQVTNILELFPDAVIIKEFYTGTTQNRPKWDKLIKQLVPGDTVVFDSVSRMSRNAEEGFKDYKRLYEMGVILVFINEPLINTAIFESTKNNLLKISVQTGIITKNELPKMSFELLHTKIIAMQYPYIADEGWTVRGVFRADDYGKRESVSLDAQLMCHWLIHSCIWSLVRDDKKYGGFVVASDRKRETHVHYVTFDEWLRVINTAIKHSIIIILAFGLRVPIPLRPGVFTI